MAMEIVFSKTLSETDIKCRLAVPTEALKHIEPTGVINNVWDVPVMDLAGHKWTFRCYTRLENHPKPAFTTGWLHYVRAKELKIGDQVVLRKKKDGAEVVQYTIEARRDVFRLFGQDIWVHVETLIPQSDAASCMEAEKPNNT